MIANKGRDVTNSTVMLPKTLDACRKGATRGGYRQKVIFANRFDVLAVAEGAKGYSEFQMYHRPHTVVHPGCQNIRQCTPVAGTENTSLFGPLTMLVAMMAMMR